MEPYSNGGKFRYSNLQREFIYFILLVGILKFEFNVNVGGEVPEVHLCDMDRKS